MSVTYVRYVKDENSGLVGLTLRTYGFSLLLLSEVTVDMPRTLTGRIATCWSRKAVTGGIGIKRQRMVRELVTYQHGE